MLTTSITDNSNTNKPLMTIPEAADTYNISEPVLRNLCKSGEVRNVRSGNRYYIVTVALENLLTGQISD